jgi:L-amino acid N-acyltransferase
MVWPHGFEIEEAVEADLPAILAIYNEVIATSTAVYSETPATLDQRLEWWRGRVAQGYPVLVGRFKGRRPVGGVTPIPSGPVVGFATFGDFRAFPGYRFTVEHTVHVAPEARGAGLGSALVKALIPQAASIGKHVMVGAIDAANEPSIRMHERLGFERGAVLTEVGFKFGRWLDLMFMTKRLETQGST